MEEFHAHFALKILGSEVHDVFAKLPEDDYQKALLLVKDCIRATDLKVFFEHRKAIVDAVESGRTGPDDPMRSAVRGMIMNACDLSSSYKPFDSAQKVTALVYREFFDEGQRLRKLDKDFPLGQDFDSANEGQIPARQVDFLDHVVEPIYKLQERVLPATKNLLERVKKTRASWKDLADQGVEFRLDAVHL
jgi:hypothetical protein